MYKKLDKLREEKGVTWYRVSKETGIPECAFSRWKTGAYQPSFRNLVKVAKYFGVKLDYFL